jgi:acetolactate decarboxylase
MAPSSPQGRGRATARAGLPHHVARAARIALACAIAGALVGRAVPASAEAAPPDDDQREDCIATYCAEDAIYQFGPAAGFAASLYEGPTHFAEVLRLGDFGLGATSPLDGEVIILDGTAYRAASTGEVEILPATTRTPLVFVKHFRTDRTVELPAVESLDDLTRALDDAIGSKNLFWAARIDGRLARIVLRSVPRQERPYKPLADVIAGQNVFTASDIRGTLVGFRFPAYLGGVNTSGWHFHFVDDARRLGGHVLDVRAPQLVAQLDRSRVLTLALPDDPEFESADLDAARGDAAFRAAIRPPGAVPDEKPLPIDPASEPSSAAAPAPSSAGTLREAPLDEPETIVVPEPASQPGTTALDVAPPTDATDTARDPSAGDANETR